jgi:putative transposase
MLVVVDNVVEPEIKFATGKIAGFDLDSRHFSLALIIPRLNRLNSLNSRSVKSCKRRGNILRKFKGSNNRERARKNLVRAHEDIANCRSDWFWKLAHDLTNKFDVLCLRHCASKECSVCGVAKSLTWCGGISANP